MIRPIPLLAEQHDQRCALPDEPGKRAPAVVHGATQGIYFDTGSDRLRMESTPTSLSAFRISGDPRFQPKSGKLLENLDIPRDLCGGLGAENGRKAA
ncbi:MAG: hypothetical protein Q7J79_00385 [Gemmatimonadales bacterium]|nr:hypothetical protein [Gemmatimonadales bacterium]